MNEKVTDGARGLVEKGGIKVPEKVRMVYTNHGSLGTDVRLIIVQ